MDSINASNIIIKLEYLLGSSGKITFSKGHLGSHDLYCFDIKAFKNTAFDQLQVDVQKLIKSTLEVNRLSSQSFNKATLTVDSHKGVTLKVADVKGVERDVEVDQSGINKELLENVQNFATSLLKRENKITEEVSQNDGALLKSTTESPDQLGKSDAKKTRAVVSYKLTSHKISDTILRANNEVTKTMKKKADAAREGRVSKQKREDTLGHIEKRAIKKQADEGELVE